jgi:predicted  nucleic acid-binding Zn-ribbon protein
LDVTVLAFAQWLSEMRSRSNSSLTQMLAEMGIIRNGITSNNADLTEFKRNTATVQQQMQSQISDLRDKLTDAYTEIANMKKTKSQFEQELHAEFQSVSEQLQFKTLELETLKKAYAHTHQQLQQQIIQLQTEVNELRMRGDDVHRHSHMTNEQNVNKISDVELAAQYASTEMHRVRNDHDQAIANLAENMNRWNDTVRDLAKEFHDFQKVMNVNHQRIQSNLWDVQAKTGSSPQQVPEGMGVRLESVGDPARSPPNRQGFMPPPGAVGSGAVVSPAGSAQACSAAPCAGIRPQSPAIAQAPISASVGPPRQWAVQ